MALNEMRPAEQGGHASDDSVAPLARLFLWVDTEQGLQRLIYGLIGLCVFLFVMDFIWHRHTKVPGEAFPAFYAIAGFVSFTVIVLGARALRLLIRRDEQYYGESCVDGEDTYPEAGTERLSHAALVQQQKEEGDAS